MRKLILLLSLALCLCSTPIFAYDHDRDRDRDDRLEWRVRHLHRMLDRVRADVGLYHGDWHLRRDLAGITDEVNRIDWRFQHHRDTGRLRADIDAVRDRLHQIELRLRVRHGEWYRWD